ncbi:MAG: hypothetical protein K5989_02955 [Lachnospiraceae bacterium]|nr:hypothetical protein [Lachnospiraceae bacterium]
MKHLSDNDIYELVVKMDEMELLSDDEIGMLDHLKECEDCFDAFCATSCALDVAGESGGLIISRIFESEREDMEVSEKKSVLSESVIGAFRIFRNSVNDKVETVLKELSGFKSRFTFIQSWIPAFSRGDDIFSPDNNGAEDIGDDDSSEIIKYEDIEDDNSFILYDGQSGDIMVQFSKEKIGSDGAEVYIKLEDGNRMAIPMSSDGGIMRGMLKDVPGRSFELYIEKKSIF